MSSRDVIAQARIKSEIQSRREMDELVLKMLAALEARVAALENAARPS